MTRRVYSLYDCMWQLSQFILRNENSNYSQNETIYIIWLITFFLFLCRWMYTGCSGETYVNLIWLSDLQYSNYKQSEPITFSFLFPANIADQDKILEEENRELNFLWVRNTLHTHCLIHGCFSKTLPTPWKLPNLISWICSFSIPKLYLDFLVVLKLLSF